MVYIDLSSRSKYKVVLRKSSISSAKIAETVLVEEEEEKWLGRGGKRAGGTLSPLSLFNLRSKK